MPSNILRPVNFKSTCVKQITHWIVHQSIPENLHVDHVSIQTVSTIPLVVKGGIAGAFQEALAVLLGFPFTIPRPQCANLITYGDGITLPLRRDSAIGEDAGCRVYPIPGTWLGFSAEGNKLSVFLMSGNCFIEKERTLTCPSADHCMPLHGPKARSKCLHVIS